jgi:hypothetical protein
LSGPGTEWKSPARSQKPTRAAKPSITTPITTAPEAAKLNFDPDLLHSTEDLVDRLVPPTLSGTAIKPDTRTSRIMPTKRPATAATTAATVANSELPKADQAKRSAKADKPTHAHSLTPPARLTPEEHDKAVEAAQKDKAATKIKALYRGYKVRSALAELSRRATQIAAKGAYILNDLSSPRLVELQIAAFESVNGPEATQAMLEMAFYEAASRGNTKLMYSIIPAMVDRGLPEDKIEQLVKNAIEVAERYGQESTRDELIALRRDRDISSADIYADFAEPAHKRIIENSRAKLVEEKAKPAPPITPEGRKELFTMAASLGLPVALDSLMHASGPITPQEQQQLVVDGFLAAVQANNFTAVEKLISLAAPNQALIDAMRSEHRDEVMYGDLGRSKVNIEGLREKLNGTLAVPADGRSLSAAGAGVSPSATISTMSASASPLGSLTASPSISVAPVDGRASPPMLEDTPDRGMAPVTSPALAGAGVERGAESASLSTHAAGGAGASAMDLASSSFIAGISDFIRREPRPEKFAEYIAKMRPEPTKEMLIAAFKDTILAEKPQFQDTIARRLKDMGEDIQSLCMKEFEAIVERGANSKSLDKLHRIMSNPTFVKPPNKDFVAAIDYYRKNISATLVLKGDAKAPALKRLQEKTLGMIKAGKAADKSKVLAAAVTGEAGVGSATYTLASDALHGTKKPGGSLRR